MGGCDRHMLRAGWVECIRSDIGIGVGGEMATAGDRSRDLKEKVGLG